MMMMVMMKKDDYDDDQLDVLGELDSQQKYVVAPRNTTVAPK
jgi:hypothetical protein